MQAQSSITTTSTLTRARMEKMHHMQVSVRSQRRNKCKSIQGMDPRKMASDQLVEALKLLGSTIQVLIPMQLP